MARIRFAWFVPEALVWLDGTAKSIRSILRAEDRRRAKKARAKGKKGKKGRR